ncbi:UNVERIFIED_CONTAM: hypothetical protein FKN15_043970 [Acipenser sinensis]
MPRPALLLLLALGCLCGGREEPLIGQGVGNAVGGAVPPALGRGRSRMGGVLDSNPALVVTERRFVRRNWCKSQPLIQTLREATVTVGFLCPGRSPPVKRRRLTLVKECRCTSIELH